MSSVQDIVTSQGRKVNCKKKKEQPFPFSLCNITCSKCLNDPFLNMPGASRLSVLEEDQWLKITNDTGLKSLFESTLNLTLFLIKIKAEYPEMESL